MAGEIISIKGEMDKLDIEAEKTKKVADSIKSILEAFDRLPQDEKEEILNKMDPSRSRIKAEDI